VTQCTHGLTYNTVMAGGVIKTHMNVVKLLCPRHLRVCLDSLPDDVKTLILYDIEQKKEEARQQHAADAVRKALESNKLCTTGKTDKFS
jgi:hypothetical protein